jgi:hypothetical protein
MKLISAIRVPWASAPPDPGPGWLRIEDLSTQGEKAVIEIQETPSVKIADQKIEALLKRLDDRDVCPCCTARVLALHAASLAEDVMGSAGAIEMFEDIIAALRENDVAAPEPLPSTETH